MIVRSHLFPLTPPTPTPTSSHRVFALALPYASCSRFSFGCNTTRIRRISGTRAASRRVESPSNVPSSLTVALQNYTRSRALLLTIIPVLKQPAISSPGKLLAIANSQVRVRRVLVPVSVRRVGQRVHPEPSARGYDEHGDGAPFIHLRCFIASIAFQRVSRARSSFSRAHRRRVAIVRFARSFVRARDAPISSSTLAPELIERAREICSTRLGDRAARATSRASMASARVCGTWGRASRAWDRQWWRIAEVG